MALRLRVSSPAPAQTLFEVAIRRGVGWPLRPVLERLPRDLALMRPLMDLLEIDASDEASIVCSPPALGPAVSDLD